MSRVLNVALMIAPAVALSLTAAPAMAQATRDAGRDAGAEAYVQQGAREVLAVLNDHAHGEAAKKEAFRALVNRFIDVPKVTRFVMGKYARSATPDQFARFSTAFRTYAENVYMKSINDYHGEKVIVTGSLVRKPGDVLVTTQIAGGRSQKPTDVVWRVLGDGGNWKVVDVQVAGVWLAITQQQDFVATIDNAGGKIDTLITQLQQDKTGEVIRAKK